MTWVTLLTCMPNPKSLNGLLMNWHLVSAIYGLSQFISGRAIVSHCYGLNRNLVIGLPSNISKVGSEKP